MSLSCDVVMDLVSLYKDDAVSPGTKGAVKEHLRSCPSCSRLYREYDIMERVESRSERREKADVSPEYEVPYTAISRRLRRAARIRSAVLAVSVTVSAFSLMLALGAMGETEK